MQLQERVRKALEEAQQGSANCHSRVVTPVWKLAVCDSTRQQSSSSSSKGSGIVLNVCPHDTLTDAVMCLGVFKVVFIVFLLQMCCGLVSGHILAKSVFAIRSYLSSDHILSIYSKDCSKDCSKEGRMDGWMDGRMTIMTFMFSFPA